MIAYLSAKSLQGDLFVTFCKVIMVWKHIDNLHMGHPSTNECVVNVVRVESNKGEVESSVNKKEENTETKNTYIERFIPGKSLYQG